MSTLNVDNHLEKYITGVGRTEAHYGETQISSQRPGFKYLGSHNLRSCVLLVNLLNSPASIFPL